jgi:hypothetical protein
MRRKNKRESMRRHAIGEKIREKLQRTIREKDRDGNMSVFIMLVGFVVNINIGNKK